VEQNTLKKVFRIEMEKNLGNLGRKFLFKGCSTLRARESLQSDIGAVGEEVELFCGSQFLLLLKLFVVVFYLFLLNCKYLKECI